MTTETNGAPAIDIDVTPVGGNRDLRCRVTVRCDGNVLYIDTLKIDSSRGRTAFLKTVAERAETQSITFDRNQAEQILMQHAADAATAVPASGDPGERRVVDHCQVLGAFGIEVLGEQEDQSIVCWVSSTGKRWRLKSPSNWRVEEMLQAMGQSAAERLWRGTEAPPDDMFTQNQLREAVAIAAAAAPRLSSNRLVGQGIWKHEERLLVVNGAEAHLYDGNEFEPVRHPRLCNKIIDFNGGKTWFPGIIEAAQQMNAEKAGRALVELQEILRNWNWTHASDPEVVAALVPSTFIQPCWTWRPLVSIIGASDSGKSTLLQDVLVTVFGDWCIAADRSSEAGLRQAIGCDASPVIIDEFDKYKQRQQVLELFRTASRGGEILRGTQDQSGLRYGVKHLAWFAAIESGDIWGQDRNRFIRPELLPPENRGALTLPGHGELVELGRRLAAAALWAAPAAVAMSDAIKNERIEGVHGRLVESFAVPAAMDTILRGGREATPETARETLRRMIVGRSVLTSQGERDEQQLLNDIMTAIVRVPQTRDDDEREFTVYVERSVGQLLNPLSRPGGRTRLLPVNGEGITVLEGRGIKIVRPRGTNSNRLFIAPGVVRETLLAGTRWAGTQIDQLLARLDDSNRVQQRLGSTRPWGISLPWPGCLGSLNE